jgi:hypothetical protein
MDHCATKWPCPHTSYCGQDIYIFLFGVATFGRYMGLQLQDSDLTPPPLSATPSTPTLAPAQDIPSAPQFAMPTAQQPTFSLESEPHVLMPTAQQPATVLARAPQVSVPTVQQPTNSLLPSQHFRFDLRNNRRTRRDYFFCLFLYDEIDGFLLYSKAR